MFNKSAYDLVMQLRWTYLDDVLYLSNHLTKHVVKTYAQFNTNHSSPLQSRVLQSHMVQLAIATNKTYTCI